MNPSLQQPAQIKPKRDLSFDYLRAFATIMIVVCHMSLGFGISHEIGRYLGGTFVDVFLLLSAYLLGLYGKEKIANAPWQFLKKRAFRIIPTYYSYLTITFIVIVVMLGTNALNRQQVIGHYTFMNWFLGFTRISTPNLGHLWFMSCILLGYLSVTLWARLTTYISNKTHHNLNWAIFFIISGIVSTLLTMRFKIAIYPCTGTMFFIFMFFKGESLINAVKTWPNWVIVSLLCVGNVGGVIYYLSGGYEYSIPVLWINLINAFLWIASAPIIFCRHVAKRVVLFLSTISFEIYLVHHPFCLGKYALANYMPTWIASIAVFAISIILGYMLSVITEAIVRIFKR